MAQGKRSAAKKIQSTENKYKALELRKKGLSIRAIAQQLRMSVGATHSAINTALKEAIEENAKAGESLRLLELERLDSYLKALHGRISKGEPSAIMTALRVIEQRSKLLGLYAPEKREVTGEGGGPQQQQVQIDTSQMSDDELRRLIHALKG